MVSRDAAVDQMPDRPGPFDGAEEADELWFLPEDDPEAILSPDPQAARPVGLVRAADWRGAEAALGTDLAELTFDLGRLAERIAAQGQAIGAVQRMALAEASGLSWWCGDRISAEQLALWLSWRIGAAEEGGEALIRTAWAARRLMAPPGPPDLAGALAASLGEEGRADPGLLTDAAAALAGLDSLHAATRGCALFHLWRSLEERPDHLRDLEAAVLGARIAAGQGAKALPFLPLSLTGFTALTVTGSEERRLAGWISGAHRAVLSALMALERLAHWQAKAEAATADLSGRTPARLIAALTAQPMLSAPQAEVATGASRAAVQRNLDTLVHRGLIREVTGQGRFRLWAAAG